MIDCWAKVALIALQTFFSEIRGPIEGKFQKEHVLD